MSPRLFAQSSIVSHQRSPPSYATGQSRALLFETWNLLRVVVKGSRIRVWFNSLHNNTNPLLDLTDPGAPVPSGKAACRVQDASAWFDNAVVLPEDPSL